MQNFICRENVLAIVNSFQPLLADLKHAIEALPAFPAPNPDWEKNNRNVMGQTEEEFWAKVEAQYPTGSTFPMNRRLTTPVNGVYLTLFKPVRPYPPEDRPILMHLHPAIRVPLKIVMGILAAAILLPASYVLMVFCVMFVLGGLKVLGL